MRTLAYLTLLCGYISLTYSLPEEEKASTSSVSLGGVPPPQKTTTETSEGERQMKPSTGDAECTKIMKKSSGVDGEAVWLPDFSQGGLDQCEDHCKQFQKSGERHSASCFKYVEHDDMNDEWDRYPSNNKDGDGPPFSDDRPEGAQVIGKGQCLCDNPLVDKIAETIVEKALPAIGEITCKTWFTAIDFVVQVGVSVIPGLGPIVSTLLNFAAQVAQTIAYAITEADKAKERYQKWLEDPDNADASQAASDSLMDNVCGNKYASDDANAVFDSFQFAADFASAPKLFAGAAKSWPPPFPKGKGKPEEIDDFINGLNPRDGKGKSGKGKSGDSNDGKSSDKDKSSAKDTSTQKADEPSSTDRSEDTRTTDKPTSTDAKSQTTESDTECGNGKRTKGGKGGNKACSSSSSSGGGVTLYSAENYVTGSVTTITKTCPRVATQACAHYSSAIGEAERSGVLTCSSSNKVPGRSEYPGAKVVSDWTKQHHEDWRSLTPNHYRYAKHTAATSSQADCQPDEWPPNYFLSSDQLRKGADDQDGQLVRWLPGSENQGAAHEWQEFCKKNDGDRGNGLRGNQPISHKTQTPDEVAQTLSWNPDLVEPKGEPKRITAKDQKTTTEVWATVSFTRAVFVWDWDFEEKPTPENNWLLEENPCWPKYIAPNDPGFCLAKDDPWYDIEKPLNEKAKGIKNSQDYSSEPPIDMLRKAQSEKEKKEAGAGRKHDLSDSSGDESKKPSNKDRKKGNSDGNDGGGSGSGSRPRRSTNEVLQIVDGRLMARDEVLNSTRPLSPEELSQVEVRRCTTPFCKEERRELGKEDLEKDTVLVPGKAPPSMPSENGAMPTMSTSYVRRDSVEGEVVPEPATGQTSGVAATDGRT